MTMRKTLIGLFVAFCAVFWIGVLVHVADSFSAKKSRYQLHREAEQAYRSQFR